MSAVVLAMRHITRILSTRRQQVTANLSLIAKTWRTLTEAQRAGFTSLSQVWSPNDKKVNGLMVFQSLNGVLLNSGLSKNILVNAPQVADFIAKLQDVTVSASHPPHAADLALSAEVTSTFRLLVQASAFSGPCIAYATRPLSSGVSQAGQSQFVQIALLQNGLDPSGTTDLTADYLATFMNPPNVGMKVGVQILPITANGFKGRPFTAIVPVTNVG